MTANDFRELPMPFSESLAARTRDALAREPGITEKKMFGGLSFLLHGKLLVGVFKDSLIARVGPGQAKTALKKPHVGVFDITGRPMKGWVVVEPEGVDRDADLKTWIRKEFREFIAKGNLIEIAVAFIMGLAFAAVVTAFTNMVLGAIAYVFGSTEGFDDLGVHKDGVLVIPIGTFILAVINFLIVAFVLFLVVKAYNRFKKEEEAAGPTEVELLTQIRDELARR